MKEKKSNKANADKNSVIYRLAGGLLTMLVIVGFLQLNFAFKMPEPNRGFEEDVISIMSTVIEPIPVKHEQVVRKTAKAKPKMSTKVVIATQPILQNDHKDDIKPSLELTEVPDFTNLFAPVPAIDYQKVREDYELDKRPTFPGGEVALMQWLNSNLEYPELCIRNGMEGQLLVEFVVDQSGKVIDVKILVESNAPFNREALRTVRRMPNWEPGVLNGHRVGCKIRLPINFVLR